jgi:ATP-dependent Clp protease ATP-binding subunit ClpC
MFERYTERARRVIFWSKYIASQRGCPEIEEERLLLGLLREDMSLAERFLGTPWAVESVWRTVDQSRPVREKPLGPGDLPLPSGGKRVLAFAVEEADRVSDRKVRTGHLMLGLLREEKGFAAEMLGDRSVHLESTRKELARVPHDDAIRKEFVRERGSLPEDVVELQTRIRLVASSRNDAIANHDFEKARAYSAEERKDRDKLYLLCQTAGTLRVAIYVKPHITHRRSIRGPTSKRYPNC